MNKLTEKQLLDIRAEFLDWSDARNSELIINLINEVLSLRYEVEMAKKNITHMGVKIQDCSPWYQQIYHLPDLKNNI